MRYVYISSIFVILTFPYNYISALSSKRFLSSTFQFKGTIAPPKTPDSFQYIIQSLVLAIFTEKVCVILLFQEYQDFISFICKKYKGSTVPNACSENMSTGDVMKLNTRTPSSHTVEKIKFICSWIRSWLQQGMITAAGLV